MRENRPLVRDVVNISLAGADAAISAARAKAEEIGVRVSVCVTDTSGGLIACARMDGPHAGTIDAAAGKARYAATRRRSTAEFIEKRLADDVALWRAVSQDPKTFIVPGGYPLRYGDVCVGGVGVSGAKHQDDVVVAEAAVAGFAAQVGR